MGVGRRVGYIVGTGAVVGLGVIAVAARLSPWPSALAIRMLFDSGARKADTALEKHVPSGITEVLDEPYAGDAEALLDVFRPHDPPGPLPTVVWVHGGAFVSGSKDLIRNYLRVLSGQGFAVVGVDYTIAPEAQYPTPVRQVCAALDHAAANADRLGLDPTRIVLAGDSAGSHIAAQVSCLVTDPSYADAVGLRPGLRPENLVGAVLFCGAFDFDLARGSTPLGSWLVGTALWAYSGRRDHTEVPGFLLASVPQHVTAAFPAAFVSAGNGDPLLAHSHSLVAALERRGVDHETLFFPDGREPRIGHEFQFDLDSDAGRLALDRATAFLHRVMA